MKSDAKNPEAAYMDRHFPGRQHMGYGVLITLVSMALSYADNLHAIAEIVLTVFMLIGITLYLMGYWKAVHAKGYAPVLFLAAFTGIIGLIIIFFLPPRPLEKAGEVDQPNNS